MIYTQSICDGTIDVSKSKPLANKPLDGIALISGTNDLHAINM
ncbi:hypothetical protein [Chryseobacterium sp. CH1]|nr:hypothetical protein [Chryseobacterium sp. CH1]